MYESYSTGDVMVSFRGYPGGGCIGSGPVFPFLDFGPWVGVPGNCGWSRVGSLVHWVLGPRYLVTRRVDTIECAMGSWGLSGAHDEVQDAESV